MSWDLTSMHPSSQWDTHLLQPHAAVDQALVLGRWVPWCEGRWVQEAQDRAKGHGDKALLSSSSEGGRDTAMHSAGR